MKSIAATIKAESTRIREKIPWEGEFTQRSDP